MVLSILIATFGSIATSATASPILVKVSGQVGSISANAGSTTALNSALNGGVKAGDEYTLYYSVDSAAQLGQPGPAFYNSITSATAVIGGRVVPLHDPRNDWVFTSPNSGRFYAQGGAPSSGFGFWHSTAGPISGLPSANPTQLSDTFAVLPSVDQSSFVVGFTDWTDSRAFGNVTSTKVTLPTAPIASVAGKWQNPLDGSVRGLSDSMQAEFNGTAFTFSMNIGVRGKVTASALQLYEEGIERMWSNQAFISYGGADYPILFDVGFTYSLNTADAIVDFSEGSCRSWALLWCTEDAGGRDHYLPYVSAHEFGHLIGLYDDYYELDRLGVPQANDPKASFFDLCKRFKGVEIGGKWCPDVMATLGGSTHQDRYFSGIVSYLEGLTGRSGFQLGFLPQDAYYSEPTYAVPTESVDRVVPVAPTIYLVLVGLLALRVRIPKRQSCNY